MRHPQARIGVCSWSLAPPDPPGLVAALQEVELTSVQLALAPLVTDSSTWAGVFDRLADAGIRIASGMLAMVGEDYSTLETIRETGGVRRDDLWDENRSLASSVADCAADAGLGLVTFHAGFIEEQGPVRTTMLTRLRELADVFAARGVAVAFETGQETAATLLEALDELDRPDVGVNFDPANMILYGMGDPVDSLRRLAGRVRQIHVKDALPTDTPGTWGREMPAGHGAVDWPAFFEVALAIEPAVDFVIEREAGATRIADVRTARDLVARHLHASTIR